MAIIPQQLATSSQIQPLIIDKHEDPGHGWFAVQRNIITFLGIAGAISSCSYQKNDVVYLEEDCDADAFFRALVPARIHLISTPHQCPKDANGNWVLGSTWDQEVLTECAEHAVDRHHFDDKRLSRIDRYTGIRSWPVDCDQAIGFISVRTLYTDLDSVIRSYRSYRQAG